ncbi:MAG: hypothetical protein ACYDAQ_15910 [Mycobacteriales bacterium]
MTSRGPLVGADETLRHQIADTFATVGQADRAWTEKLWATAFARDGSCQLDFGLGIYPNRGVIDGFAGISRGVEQWTVRASGARSPGNGTALGPLRYEVLDQWTSCRFSLAPNDIAPISFEWTFTGAVPPFLGKREIKRSPDDAGSIPTSCASTMSGGRAAGWNWRGCARSRATGSLAGRGRGECAT